jgi:PAS domain-containing protein
MNTRSIRPLIILLLLVLSTLFYYFGELVDWAAWNALRLNFFYGIHDVHRLVFLAPIIYAGYTAGKKGAVIVTLISLLIFLPRAFFISNYPDPLLRMMLFVIFAGVIGWLVGALREQALKSRRLENFMTTQRDKMLKIVDNIADGIVITGPDHKIRFMNSRMSRELGEGIGLACYDYLHHLKEPCSECKIQSVIKDQEICRWQCRFADGSVHEVVAAPYTDADGTACQISIFRDIAQRKPA